MTVHTRAERFWGMLKRHHAGKSLGVIIGSVGGWFGAVMGFVIGYMIDTLLAQRRTDRAIADYFENPGPSPFLERNPGSAAFCGLAALVLRENEKKEELDEALTASRIARLAAAVFAVDAEPREELEMFARVAAARAGELNPDLLTESLCARVRGRPGESRLRETVCEGLEGLAESALAVELSARVAALVQPVRKAKKRLPGDDPYEILGISRDAPEEEVKNVYRRLAVQFHPDGTGALTEKQKKSAAEAFMRIDDAYRRILSTKKN